VSNDSSSATAIVLNQRLHHHHHHSQPHSILSLTASERTRSRHIFSTDDGIAVALQLPRGTTLQDGDLLTSESGDIVRVSAKPEPTITVTSENSLTLLRAAYHLGNRHVSLEISPTYLRFSPDPVLEGMLVQLGLQIVSEIAPFYPQGGAYSHQH